MAIKMSLTKKERDFLSKEGVIPSDLKKIFSDEEVIFSDDEYFRLEKIFSDLEGRIGFDPETGYPNGEDGLIVEKLLDKLCDSSEVPE